MMKKLLSIIKFYALTLIFIAVFFSDMVAASHAGEIHDAIDRCDLEKVLAAIKKDPASVNKTCETNLAHPLIMAISKGNFEVFKALVDSGANVNAENIQGIPAVLFVSHGTEMPMRHYLIEKGARTNVSLFGKPLLLNAAFAGDTRSIELLLERGADINAFDSDGNNAIMISMFFADAGFIKYLVELGVRINSRNKNGENALISALNSRKFDVARYLIDKSIEIEIAVDVTKISVLRIALEKGAPDDIVNALIDRGASVDPEPGDYQYTVLTDAVNARRDPTLLKKMIEKGADVNHANRFGDTALMAAVEYCDDTGCVKLLIEKGADVNAVGYSDRTAYSIAASKNNQKAMKLLREAGVKTAPENQQAKDSLLMCAVMNENTVEINALLKAGASPEAKFQQIRSGPEETVLNYSIKTKKYEAMKPLLEKGAAIYDEYNRFEGALARVISSDDEKAVKIFFEYSKNIDIRSERFTEAFFDALMHGNAEMIKLFIKAGADVKCRNKWGNTPLMESLRLKNKPEVIKLLIETGSDINEKDNEGDPAIIKAVKNSDVETIKLLLKKGADATALNKQGMNALMVAKSMDDKEPGGYKNRNDYGVKGEIAKLLIEAGAKVELKDKAAGRKMLLQAICDGSTSEVKAVIGSGISINDTVENETTPLMKAVIADNFDMVDFLVKSGADINFENSRGESALSCSLPRGDHYSGHSSRGGGRTVRNVNRRIVKYLISLGALINKAVSGSVSRMADNDKNYELIELAVRSGADINFPDEWGKTALMRAVWHEKNIKLAELLLNSGADVNAADNEGVTALMIAAGSYRNQKMTSLLIKKGAKNNLKDKAGRTALWYAVEHGGLEVTELLLKNGADANGSDNEGNNALIYLMQTHEYGLETGELELVLKKTKNINHKNKKNETALFLAAGKGLTAAVKKLQKKGAKADMNDRTSMNAFFINAVLSGNTREAAILIKKGANVNQMAGKSISKPLLFKAQDNGDLEMFKLLADNGAELKYKAGNWQEDAFRDAVFREQLGILKYFASRGIDLKRCPDRMGVMYNAARSNSGKTDIMEFLLKTGGDINYCDDEGDNLLQIALYHQASFELIKFLVEKGADVNHKNNKGETVLYKAASYWKGGACELLLEHGADAYMKNNDGRTCMEMAVLNGSGKTVKNFIESGVTIDLKDEKNLNAMLRNMALDGDTAEVAALLDKGARPD
ncbi:MAG TPA: ankyrin repeat domain-containing protein, partial [Candidatus Wallbacteria bacterium]|nr:ankyrin repeat domain-containing protein [Candidatus Wallbacteria bacterium]